MNVHNLHIYGNMLRHRGEGAECPVGYINCAKQMVRSVFPESG